MWEGERGWLGWEAELWRRFARLELALMRSVSLRHVWLVDRSMREGWRSASGEMGRHTADDLQKGKHRERHEEEWYQLAKGRGVVFRVAFVAQLHPARGWLAPSGVVHGGRDRTIQTDPPIAAV